MGFWKVSRFGKPLGVFIADRLTIEGDTVVALRGTRIIGAVAAAQGTTWAKSCNFITTIEHKRRAMKEAGQR